MISPEQLRKFAEACGYWTRLHPEHDYLQVKRSDSTRNKLRAAEAEFLLGKDAVIGALEWFCSKDQATWTLERHGRTDYLLTLYRPEGKISVNGSGDTINEAVISAILSAVESETREL